MALQTKRPTRAQDRVSFGVAAALFVVCGAAGVALVRMTAAPEPRKGAHVASPPPASKVQVSKTRTPPKLATPKVTAAQVASVTPKAVADLVLLGKGSVRLQQGRVAYLRCETEQGRAVACPRDREFEDAVWGVIAKLPQDVELTHGGTADLRMDFRESPAAVQWRPVAGGQLPFESTSEAVKNVGTQLRSLRVKVPTKGLVVAFQFTLDVDVPENPPKDTDSPLQ